MSEPTNLTGPPRTLVLLVGRVCDAGQHNACALVSDPYEDREVWVCSCCCHLRKGEFNAG